jgi:hypothetical protein
MKTRSWLAALLLVLILGACGAPAPRPVAAQRVAETVVVKEMAKVEEKANSTPAATPAPGVNVAPILSNPVGRMVIKDGQMVLLVEDTDVALQQVTQLTADYGGYLLNSETWYTDGFKYGRLRMGVPSASFENIMNALRRLGIRVVSEESSGQDVSAEYSDLQSKLINLGPPLPGYANFWPQPKRSRNPSKLMPPSQNWKVKSNR